MVNPISTCDGCRYSGRSAAWCALIVHTGYKHIKRDIYLPFNLAIWGISVLVCPNEQNHAHEHINAYPPSAHVLSDHHMRTVFELAQALSLYMTLIYVYRCPEWHQSPVPVLSVCLSHFLDAHWMLARSLLQASLLLSCPDSSYRWLPAPFRYLPNPPIRVDTLTVCLIVPLLCSCVRVWERRPTPHSQARSHWYHSPCACAITKCITYHSCRYEGYGYVHDAYWTVHLCEFLRKC